jgi:hypothetical protein
MSTISNQTIFQTVTLGSGTYPHYASPLTITSTGEIKPGGGFGDYGSILGPASNAWTVDNQGTILGEGYAVLLYGGSSLGNNGGLIGGSGGVYIGDAAGSMTNSGTIIGTSSNGVGLGMGAALTTRG